HIRFKRPLQSLRRSVQLILILLITFNPRVSYCVEKKQTPFQMNADLGFDINGSETIGTIATKTPQCEEWLSTRLSVVQPPLFQSNHKQAAINIPIDPDRNVLQPLEKSIFGRYSLLAHDTGYLIIPAVVVMGLLYVAPESVSKWSEEDKDISLKKLGGKWSNNVKDGPVWDKDDRWLNWIAHPYWGATYYIHARHYAYSKWESFWYSAFISTCLYEYGIEAFAEKPSIQDLFSTPIGGWLVGEYIFSPLEARIMANNNKLWGSKILGKTARFILDPIGSIIRPLRHWKEKRFQGARLQKEVSFETASIRVDSLFVNRGFGLRISFRLY
ncbi:DUF3943 domain-containing protein, partial [bacterium]|nr:DUF3943 domain-containing protein [bacterium]